MSASISGAEFSRCANPRVVAQLFQLALDLGPGHRLTEGLVQPVAQGRRQASRRGEAEPRDHVIIGHQSFRHRRHVWKARMALLGCHGERAQLVGLEQRLGVGEGHDMHVEPATDQVVVRRADAALVGHVGDLGAGLGEQQLHRHVQCRADAGGAVGELARLALGLVEKSLDGLEARIGRHGEDEGKARDDRDEVEIAQHVVAERLVGRRDHGLPAGHQVKHAAVGLQARDLRRRQPLGRAGLGFDHDLHAQDLGQRRREVTRDRIGVGAGIVAVHQPDRIGRPGLRPPKRRYSQRGSGREKKGPAFHDDLIAGGAPLQWRVRCLPDRGPLARS